MKKRKVNYKKVMITRKIINKVCAFFTFASLLFTFGCLNNDNLQINGPSKVNINESITLTVETKEETDLNGLTWTSSDEEIATVKEGVVSGISIGEVTITATLGKQKAEVIIKVTEKAKAVNLFNGVNIETIDPICYEKIEISLFEIEKGYIKANYNPFDYNQIYVYGVFTSPDGKRIIQTPAFWYRDYEIVLDRGLVASNGVQGTASNDPNEPQGLERVVWRSDEYEYRLRFQPDRSGEWRYQIYVSLEGDINQILTGEINVKESQEEYKGIISVSKENNRTFVFEDGSSYIPVGTNLGWWTSSSRKTYDYDVWMSKMNENNMNIARIWMAPWGFCLHWGESYLDLSDRLNYAARLDRVIELANLNDIYVELTLINHGQFSSSVNSTWAENPYNAINGGILTKPDKFFSSGIAKRAYKNELLYIIGRYGYSDNILAWELFNEVNWTDNAELNNLTIKQWHDEMAKFIRSNDSYNHMITTSYNGETGSAYSLKEIDFTNPHNYGYSKKNYNIALPQALEKLYKMYNKPILHSEIGLNWESGYETGKADPTGVSLRQQSWAGMLGGGAGGAMNWWWDSWLHPSNLYYQFKGAGAFAKLMNLNSEDYKLLHDGRTASVTGNNGILGYRFNDRIYGYVFDKAWTYMNPNVSNMENIDVRITLDETSFISKNASITFYNALTGDEVLSNDINVVDGYFNITLPTYNSDIAFIIKEK